MKEPTIDESGFDSDLQNNADSFAGQSVKSESLTNNFHVESQDAKKTRFKKLFIGGITLACLAAGGYFYLLNDGSASHDKTFAVEPDPATNEGSEPKPVGNNDGQVTSLTVGADATGVKINGHHDLLASMLLQGYPTREEMIKEVSRIQGANVSQEELDVFLLSVKNNADEIQRMKESNGSTHELAKQIAEANKILKDLKLELSLVNERVQKLEKNHGWYQNRISKLESGIAPQSKQTLKPVIQQQAVAEPVRRVELQSQSSWQVNGASENLAFIKNVNSGGTLRVTRGFEIPGCGQVTDINPSQQKVTTTTCIISN